MPKFILVLFTILAAINLFIIGGCAHDPALPELNAEPPGLPVEHSPVENPHYCFGFYELVIDTAISQIEVFPLRSSDWHFNVVGVLNSTMGVSAAAVPSESDPATGLFVFDITLTHPFATKPQFAGFDVKGILITPGTLSIGSLSFADIDETRLENADGYSRWWNPAEFTVPGFFGYTKGNLTATPSGILTAMVNPYKQFADTLGPTDNISVLSLTGADARGVFKAGSTNTRRYKIRFPMNPGPQVKYGYAVDASWAMPSPNPPIQIPEDFPINANQPEPYYVKITPSANSLYYDNDTGMHGGILRLDVSVGDWQGYDNGNVPGEVETVRAYAPDLFADGQTMDSLGASDGKAQYSIDLWDIAEPASDGEALVIVRVQSTGDLTYDQGAAPAPANLISSFAVIKVPITDPGCTPDANNSIGEAGILELNSPVVNGLCGGVDDSDWFKLDLPSGYEYSGYINFFHDAGNLGDSALGLYRADGNQITASDAFEGYNTISISWLLPGTYYVMVSYTEPGKPIQYMLEADVDLIDISPSNPVEITPDNFECMIGTIFAEKIGENVIYGAGTTGTFAFDVSNSTPVILGRTYDEITNYEPAFIYPYLYYVESPSDTPSGIDLVDYSDNSAPVHYEDVLEILDPVTMMVANSEWLFILTEPVGTPVIRVFDYSANPQDPQYIGSFDVIPDVLKIGLLDPEGSNTQLLVLAETEHNTYTVEDIGNVVIDNHAYIVGNKIYRTFDIDANRLCIIIYNFDTSKANLNTYIFNPANGNFESPAWVTLNYDIPEVAISGSTACAISGDDTITLFDLSVPLEVTEKGSVTLESYVGKMDAGANKLGAVVLGQGFSMVNIGDPMSPDEISKSECLNSPVEAAFSSSYSYFLDSLFTYGALVSVQKTGTDSFAIRDVDYLDDSAQYLAVWGDIIVAGSDTGNAWLFDIGVPDNPEIDWSKQYASPVTGVAIYLSHAFVVLQNGKIEILDLSEFPIVTETEFTISGSMSNVVRYGVTLCGSNSYSVKIIDIANPTDPIEISSFAWGMDYIQDLAFNQHYLNILNGDLLKVVDFHDAYNPTYSDWHNLPYGPDMRYLAVEKSFGYAGTNYGKIVAVNLFPMGNPAIFGEPFGDMGNSISDLAVNDGLLYVMYYGAGVRIFDLY